MSLFVTLEGPDGGGKSTQASRLVDYLQGRGLNVLLTREPGGTLIGDQIRRTLMDLGNTGMHPRTEILLFSASRAQIVHQVIRPHLESGGIVVCDRFYDSTLAYQGYGHGLDLQALQAITAFATGGLRPDLTLLLDLPAEDGLRRRKRGGQWNRLDAYDLAFHQRVRQGYFALADAEPERWVRVDATQPLDAVHAAIRDAVDARLG
ncbi:MAG: dTMP kinase [Anaerolineales bacterium]|nr:dTMP kinase [Anaerolineales bacterium]